MAWLKLQVSESNFHEELLPGREVQINSDHIRMIVHDKDSSLLFFQNDDCVRVRPKLELSLMEEGRQSPIQDLGSML